MSDLGQQGVTYRCFCFEGPYFYTLSRRFHIAVQAMWKHLSSSLVHFIYFPTHESTSPPKGVAHSQPCPFKENICGSHNQRNPTDDLLGPRLFEGVRY